MEVTIMPAEKSRIQFVDAVKGISIIWLILYHLIAPSGFKNVLTQLEELFLIVFFFYSGYFYSPGKRTLSENLKNRTKSVLVPFFKYSLCFWLVGTIYLVATKSEPLKEAFLCLRNFFAGCIWNRTIQNWFGWEYYSLGKRYFFLADFWFLLAMLFASILFFLIIDRVIKNRVTMLITVIVLFALTGVCQYFSLSLPYNIQLVPFWTAFMIIGAYAGQKDLSQLPKLSKGASWILSVILVAGGIVIAMLKSPSTHLYRGSFGENEVLSMLLCIVAALLFCWGIGMLFALIEKSGVRLKEIAWLGSHSLYLYIFHMFFAWIVCVLTGFSVMYEKTVDSSVLAGSFIVSAISIALCILTGLLSDKLKAKKKVAESSHLYLVK